METGDTSAILEQQRKELEHRRQELDDRSVKFDSRASTDQKSSNEEGFSDSESDGVDLARDLDLRPPADEDDDSDYIQNDEKIKKNTPIGEEYAINAQKRTLGDIQVGFMDSSLYDNKNEQLKEYVDILDIKSQPDDYTKHKRRIHGDVVQKILDDDDDTGENSLQEKPRFVIPDKVTNIVFSILSVVLGFGLLIPTIIREGGLGNALTGYYPTVTVTFVSFWFLGAGSFGFYYYVWIYMDNKEFIKQVTVLKDEYEAKQKAAKKAAKSKVEMTKLGGTAGSAMTPPYMHWSLSSNAVDPDVSKPEIAHQYAQDFFDRFAPGEENMDEKTFEFAANQIMTNISAAQVGEMFLYITDPEGRDDGEYIIGEGNDEGNDNDSQQINIPLMNIEEFAALLNLAATHPHPQIFQDFCDSCIKFLKIDHKLILE